jgi:ketosteroid isomerase-like protein
MAHPNEELLRREAEASATGASLQEEFYTEDHVLHYPGKSTFAGEYRGHEGLAAFGRKISEVASSVERELHDALANDEHGVQLLTVRGERKDGRKHEWRAVWVCHFRDGKISESWGHIADQEALDEFLAG